MVPQVRLVGGGGSLDKWLSGLADPLSACPGDEHPEAAVQARQFRREASLGPQCTDMPRPTSSLASRTLHTLTWPWRFLFLLPTSPTGFESHGFHLLLSGQRKHVRYRITVWALTPPTPYTRVDFKKVFSRGGLEEAGHSIRQGPGQVNYSGSKR